MLTAMLNSLSLVATTIYRLSLACVLTALLSPAHTFAATGTAAEAIAADRLKVAKDFRVERLYSVPKDQEGSWVNLCVDPKGRLIVSDQYGGLYRIVPAPLGADASQTKIEKIPVALGEAHGLLWAFDSLYVVVNKGERYASGLYRVRDTNNDDILDEVTLLRKIEGGGEHGPHAVLLHPDGKSLVVVCGNHTKPTHFDNSRVPLVWGEDHLIPRMWDAGGHAVGILAPGGWIARTDAEGKSWELLSMGYRNEFDAAYNREGELFTYDADMEWDINTPWYRPTRVCHAVSGSEFGWRSGAGKWPVYYPDSLPSVVNVGPGSPTGISFGYGARFPAKYQEALFMCDWSYGKLYAAHLSPSGSTYSGTLEEFISGAPLPLTDVIVSPKDGALYFTVGGRRTQSGLYRVTYTGPLATSPSSSPKDSARLRDLRRQLEAFHGHKDPKAIGFAWPYLRHADRFIRSAARVAIEHQDPSTWQDKALKAVDAQTSLTALLALVRVGDKSLEPQLLDALSRLTWTHLTSAQQLELLRIYSLAFIRMGSPSAAASAVITQRLDGVYPSNSRELNAELSKLLIHLEAPSAAAKTLALLSKASTQEEQMDYAYSLRVLKTGWTKGSREEYFRWFLKAASYRGGHSFAGFVRNIRTDAEKNLSSADRVALKPILEAKPQRRSPLEALGAGLLGSRTNQHEWKVEEFTEVLNRPMKSRNFERGRTLFSAAVCTACHRFNNEGGSYGPDLSGVVGRFSAKDLLESILLPNKEVSDQYAPVIVKKTDGESVTGRVVNMAGEGIMISPNMFDPDDIVVVNRSEIRSIEPSKVSMMPEGLVNALTQEEILDLMAYLLSRGEANHPMFKSK